MGNRAAGVDYSLEEWVSANRRSWKLWGLIDQPPLRLTPKNHRPPGSARQPLPDEGSAGYVPPFEAMKTVAYAARGWEPVTCR